MVSIKLTKHWIFLQLLLLSVTGASPLFAADGRGVENLVITLEQDAVMVEIAFSCPNRYLGENLEGNQRYLQIDLQRMTACSFAPVTAVPQEVALPDNKDLAGLGSVEYQATLDDQAILHLRFDRPVSTLVTESADQRSLSIRVETNELVASSAQPAAVPVPARTMQQNGNDSFAGSGAALGDRPMSEEQLESLMDEGRAAILAENYSRAIQIYTRVLRAPENARTPEALEMLGLSRERNEQIAQAVAEYRRFLEHYPDGEGAGRVNQRLAGLVTGSRTPRVGRASAGRDSGDASTWDVYGGISQYYRGDTFKLEGRDSINAQSSILSNVDLLVRHRGSRMDFSGRATLGNLWDLLSADEGPGNQTRLYQGYIDMEDRTSGLSGRLGRQSLRKNGVLGRFDGVHLAWDFKPGIRFNLMGGYPVDTTADGLETRRNFFGAAVDLEEIADRVDLSFFYNVQKVDGLDNREAVGSELRYFDDSKSLVAMIDYDIGFKKLNNFLLLGNWRVRKSLTLSASVDQRTSPYLTTRNALMGQHVGTIEDLLQIYSEDEIRALAESRSGEVSSFRLGASQKLSERFQLNVDVSMSEFQGAPASMELPGYVDQATQYYSNINLVGSSLFMDGDTSIFGLRYTEGGSTSTSTAYFDSRFPLSSKFQLNPRLRYSYRNSQLRDADATIAAPSLRLIYRVSRRNRLDFEAGGQWISQKGADSNGDRTSWFVYFGYRADF